MTQGDGVGEELVFMPACAASSGLAYLMNSEHADRLTERICGIK